MKGIILKDKHDEVACCRGMYVDLVDGVSEFDIVYKCFYLHLCGKQECYFQTMSYCMYCGKPLPNLSLTYDDELEKAVGKEYCEIEQDEIPAEFHSDEWWRKRGL